MYSYKIRISPSHIECGQRGSRDSCPVARALQDLTGRSWLVDSDVMIDRYSGTRHATPEIVREFLYGFDAGNFLDPFEFEIWIYD